jgi:hypothetical protein
MIENTSQTRLRNPTRNPGTQGRVPEQQPNHLVQINYADEIPTLSVTPESHAGVRARTLVAQGTIGTIKHKRLSLHQETK